VGKGYLTGFSSDIFISYNHIDNHQVDARGTLWVDNFHKELHGLINTCVGHPVTIWRDPRVTGSSVFSEEIAQRLRETVILIAIVSPGYVESEWCSREREIFVHAASGNGGLDIGNSRRIIKAVKLPVPIEDLPEVLKPALGFELFSLEEATGKPIDYLFDPKPEAERLYRRTLSHLAQSVADLLKLMFRGSEQTPQDRTKTVVYLAEPSSELQRERDALRMELEARGCTVVPRQPLPHTIEGCTEVARRELARARISIHFLGKRYGLIPEGGERSLIELQTEMAAALGASLKSVLWIPRALEAAEPLQAAYLSRIRTQQTSAANFELIEGSFEDLKNFLVDLLPRERAPEKVKAPVGELDSEAVPQIYVVRDREDREQVAPLIKFLFEHGIEVLTPADEGEEVQLRQDHQENLKACDGVMIWWGKTKKVWLDYMMRDLDRARGLGRTAPFRSKAVCIGSPPAPEKSEFMTHKAQVFSFLSGFSSEALKPVLEAFKVDHA